MFSIRKKFSIHESRSKYYSVYEISGPKGSAIAFAYGKYNVAASLEPRHHGQLSVDLYPTRTLPVSVSSRKISMKKRRGYIEWTGTNYPASDDREFTASIWNIFPDKSAKNILDTVILGKHIGAAEEDAMETDEAPVSWTEPEEGETYISTVAVPVEAPKSVKLEDWGTW